MQSVFKSVRILLKSAFAIFASVFFFTFHVIAETTEKVGLISYKSSTFSSDQSSTSSSSESPSQLSFPSHLLWRIQVNHKKLPPVTKGYLFGTIHINHPEVNKLADRVTPFMDQVYQLCLEILPTPDVQQQVARAMFLSANESLERLMKEPWFSQLSVELSSKGWTPLTVDRLKPWAAMVNLSMPDSNGGEALDQQLFSYAQRKNKATCSLETWQEQLDVFEQLSIEEQVSLLKENLSQVSEIKKSNKQLIAAYIQQDIDELWKISQAQPLTQHEELVEKLTHSLIVERNKKMVERMQPLLSGAKLANGKVFFAVGALHLPSEYGLLNLLKQAGYIVKPVSL